MTRRITSVPEQRRPPVRVRLRRLTANQSKPYPPDGQGKIWWERLKKALGTESSDFLNASLLQLQLAAQLPEHVHVSDGGQAVIGSVRTQGAPLDKDE